jgi:hypothetical protein
MGHGRARMNTDNQVEIIFHVFRVYPCPNFSANDERGIKMFKRLLFLWILLALLVSACQPTAAPTEIISAATRTPLVLATRAATQAATPEGQVTITAGTGCTAVSTFNFPEGESLFPAVSERDWAIGPADASVTILEYSDFM